MSDQINYLPYLSELKPPEGLTKWAARQGNLKQQFFIFKSGWRAKEVGEKKKRCVVATCTACHGETELASAEVEVGCWRAQPRIGFFLPEIESPVYSGRNIICPMCGSMVQAKHASELRGWFALREWTVQVTHVPAEGRTDRLALVEWVTERRIDREGRSQYRTFFWDAYIVEERKLVRTAAYTNAMYGQQIESDMRQNAKFRNPNMDWDKVDRAIDGFRKIYDELFELMNDSRVRNGYEPVAYRKGYFPHFQPGEGNGILALFGKALGISTEVTALPTTINGLTHTFRPGIQYFGNALERTGFNTCYDAVEGFDKYIEGVADVIYQTENIQRLRAFSDQVRYRTTTDGLREQIDQVLREEGLSERDRINRIKEIYEKGKFSLSNFVVELEEYTNLLANKKSRADRNLEQALGRNMYNLVKTLEGRVAANMVAVNPGSWLTNFIPLTQCGAMLDRGMLAHGVWDTAKVRVGILESSSSYTAFKMQTAQDYGITMEDYYAGVYGAVDTDGDGKVTQKDKIAAIAALDLSNEKKAVLYQLADSGWTPKNNPFATGVGQEVYDLIQKEKERRENEDGEEKDEMRGKARWENGRLVLPKW